ncbi:hypothetical protein Bxe_A4509 [Paraburkholderia xenovorans LB400]|uniref:Uncharacterized protein n=1 Tax=Paraburkholderia xenovorans (strain LB400) TaxID=266265 RepID=Q143E0_PARXL|nr:hypothetical protein Bxe_A4509 [Paraburkholderia xenovorans LB400]
MSRSGALPGVFFSSFGLWRVARLVLRLVFLPCFSPGFAARSLPHRAVCLRFAMRLIERVGSHLVSRSGARPVGFAHTLTI